MGLATLAGRRPNTHPLPGRAQPIRPGHRPRADARRTRPRGRDSADPPTTVTVGAVQRALRRLARWRRSVAARTAIRSPCGMTPLMPNLPASAGPDDPEIPPEPP